MIKLQLAILKLTLGGKMLKVFFHLVYRNPLIAPTTFSGLCSYIRQIWLSIMRTDQVQGTGRGKEYSGPAFHEGELLELILSLR